MIRCRCSEIRAAQDQGKLCLGDEEEEGGGGGEAPLWGTGCETYFTSMKVLVAGRSRDETAGSPFCSLPFALAWTVQAM